MRGALKMDKLTARVTRISRHSPEIITIYFTLYDGTNLEYAPGQYITVYFENTKTPEGKAYSLSSAPHEKWMSITVKKIGEYSGLLHELKVGDTFLISRAYGFFNPATKQPLVCLGAGVGIAPIWSVLKDEYKRDKSRLARFFYSNKTVADIAHHHEITSTSRDTRLEVRHHITQQKTVPEHMHPGRIDIDTACELGNEAKYLICGSVQFVKSMWDGLTDHGISLGNISTEVFFEQ